MTEKTSRWMLLLLVVCLPGGGWLVRRSENIARIDFERARQEWRLERFESAIDGFERLADEFPTTSYAPRALWEIASICYYNLNQVEHATTAYRSIAASYPDHFLATESRLKLAELYEREFGDLEQARNQWEQALQGDLGPDRRRLVALKVADTFLYSTRLEEALLRLQALLLSDDEVSQQARVRIGTILQIRKDHARAVPVFRQVLAVPDCGQCRLQARLALIESYEVLDQIPSAIAEARRIDPKSYPAGLKNLIIARLLEKQLSFRPRLLNAD